MLTTRSTGSVLASVTIGWILLAASLMIAPSARAQGTTAGVQWTRQFGTAQFDAINALAFDGSGLYAAGVTDGALPGQVSAGDQDAFVRKYDSTGTELWTRQFGTPGSDTGWSVAADASGAYIVGETSGTLPGQVSAGGEDAFVRKYNANGDEVWTRQFGSTLVGACPVECDRAYSVALDATSVYAVGTSGGTLPNQTNAGGFDAWVRRYDKNGNELWTHQFGSSGSDTAWGVAVSATAVYVAGEAGSSLPGQIAAGQADAFVRAFDKAGNEEWTRQFGSSVDDVAWAVAAHQTAVYLTGNTEGTLAGQISVGDSDAFLRKYDPDGTVISTRQFGTPERDIAFALYVNPTESYVAGRTSGAMGGQASTGGVDAFARKLDANATDVWTVQFGSAVFDIAFGLVVDGSSAFVAGYTDGTLPGQTSAGDSDAFVTRLAEGQATPQSPAGLSGLLFIGILAAVAAVAIFLVFFLWRRRRTEGGPPAAPPPTEEGPRPPPPG